MNGREARAGRTGPWLALLCCLAGCNAAPPSKANPEVMAAVQALTDRSGAQTQVVTLPNGERFRRVTFPTGFNHVLIAKPGPTGEPAVTCVDNAPAAEAFLTGAPPRGAAE